MYLSDIAVVCSSEESSDEFYKNVLGLRKIRSKVVPATLSKQIFNVDHKYKIIDYGNADIKFEVFLAGRDSLPDKKIYHICLEVEDREAFLNKCTAMDVQILKISKGDSCVIFIKDYDGNLFEIKGKN
jgi:catechol 2,3-dioxygenase-like lactoylglutathione lyase family enzyme